jgi:hypothetical protein
MNSGTTLADHNLWLLFKQYKNSHLINLNNYIAIKY